MSLVTQSKQSVCFARLSFKMGHSIVRVNLNCSRINANEQMRYIPIASAPFIRHNHSKIIKKQDGNESAKFNFLFRNQQKPSVPICLSPSRIESSYFFYYRSRFIYCFYTLEEYHFLFNRIHVLLLSSKTQQLFSVLYCVCAISTS